jgi:hypothetical protein
MEIKGYFQNVIPHGLWWGIHVALLLGTPLWASEPTVSSSTASVHHSTLTVSTGAWRAAPKAPFSVGEDLHFVIKWGVVVGGHSTLSVSEIVEISSRPTYHIVSTARSGGMVTAFYKVQDRNDVWLDQNALVTVRYEKKIREGKFRIEETSHLDQVNHRWKTNSFRIDKNKYEEKEGDLPPDALDSFGSLYYVRSLSLEPGQSHTIDVHNSDKVYPLVVNVIKREKVKVPAGKFNTVLVEPILRGPGIFISKGKKLQVWLTDDERKMPVRMRSEVFIGHVSAELIKY